jgi:hypothetical protein
MLPPQSAHPADVPSSRTRCANRLRQSYEDLEALNGMPLQAGVITHTAPAILFGRCLLRFAEVRLASGLMDAHVPRKRFIDAGTGV